MQDNEMKEKIKFFFLDGSINYDELNKIDKIRLKKSMNKNLSKELVSLQKNMIIDRSDKHTIKPILDYVIKKTY